MKYYEIVGLVVIIIGALVALFPNPIAKKAQKSDEPPKEIVSRFRILGIAIAVAGVLCMILWRYKV